MTFFPRLFKSCSAVTSLDVDKETRAQGLKGAHLGTKSKYLIRFLKL